MRKHTGQMYSCRTCDFKSVNKSHLLEHEATHSGVVHKCVLCKKHYSTIKSLVNHVRIYHSKTEEGRAYHQQFVHAKEGMVERLGLLIEYSYVYFCCMGRHVGQLSRQMALVALCNIASRFDLLA